MLTILDATCNLFSDKPNHEDVREDITNKHSAEYCKDSMQQQQQQLVSHRQFSCWNGT